jgi:hypothetical protein
MAKKEMTIQATPQNKLLGTVSRGLGSLRSGMGSAGDFLIGTAPEEIEDWSYGFSPFKENPSGSRIPIEVRPGREERLIDTLGLPVAEAYGLTKLAGKGIKKGIEKAVSTPVKEGRREFISKAGQALTGAAVAGMTPDLVKAIRKGVPDVTKDITKTVSGKVFINTMDDIYSKALSASDNAFNKMSSDEYKNLAQKLLNLPNAERWAIDEGDIGGMTSGEYAVRDYLTDMFEKQMHDELRKNSAYKPYAEYIKPGGQYSFKKSQNTIKKAAGGAIENTTHYRKMI